MLKYKCIDSQYETVIPVFSYFSSAWYMLRIIAHTQTAWCMHTSLACLVFVYSTSGIVFNPCTDSITDHRQSKKIIYPYFISDLCEGPIGRNYRFLMKQSSVLFHGILHCIRFLQFLIFCDLRDCILLKKTILLLLNNKTFSKYKMLISGWRVSDTSKSFDCFYSGVILNLKSFILHFNIRAKSRVSLPSKSMSI